MTKTILIAGGSGLIGTAFIDTFSGQYNIRVLTRRARHADKGIQYFNWKPSERYVDPEAFEGVDVIINLAGANVGDKRWTRSRKKLLLDSRIDSTETLFKAVTAAGQKLDTYIGASAIGYYGDSGVRRVDETSGRGDGFLADVTETWESAHNAFRSVSERTVICRIGIVLSMDGGALPQLMQTSAAGMYNYFGDGSAVYSWIHIGDMVRLFDAAIDNVQINGVYNAVAPNPVTIKALMKTIKEQKGLGVLLPVPAFVLKTVMGEMAEIVLNSSNVSADKIGHAGFHFDYPLVRDAVQNLLEKA